MKVKVYKNLHNGMYSIQAMHGDNKGRVVGYATRLLLDDVTFKVSESGRQRVINEKRKNVHAYVCGTLRHALDYIVRLENIPLEIQQPFEHDCDIKVAYNPYKWATFMAYIDYNLHQTNFAKSAYLGYEGVLIRGN